MFVLAEFALLTARTGLSTVLHVPSGTLIHSRVDPWKEAQELVREHQVDQGQATVIVGGGLGYVADAVLDMTDDQHAVFVIEPHGELQALSRGSRPEAAFTRSSRVSVLNASTPASLYRQMKQVPSDARIIVSPYLLRLTENNDFPLSGFLSIVRAECASRSVYDLLLAAREGQSKHIFGTLPSIMAVRLLEDKLVVVAGAGPSLNECLPYLIAKRSKIVLLAASGAVPALMKAQVVPDWVFALEAREAVLEDVKDLPPSSKVVVFSATNHQVLALDNLTLMAGTDISGNGMETRGGSSVIPAVDFALRNSQNDIALVGLDLSNQHGAYAHGSKRVEMDAGQFTSLPPKFLSMRAGLERILLSGQLGERTVFHVLPYGKPLQGTRQISPNELRTILNQRSVREVPCE